MCVCLTSLSQTCFNRCNDGSNTHFGTQNSKECFCGDGSQLDKHHDPSNKPTCNLECAGDASETCGGERAMTVYRFTDEVPPTPARFDPGHSYTSMGCFADNKKGRVMKWAKDASDMTAEVGNFPSHFVPLLVLFFVLGLGRKTL